MEHESIDLSDRELLEQCSTLDQGAFEALIQRYHGRLQAFVFSLLKTSEEVEDVMQFTWLQLYRSLPQLQGERVQRARGVSLKPWLFQVARNRCIDAIRQRRRRALCFSEMTEEEEECSPWLLVRDPSLPPEAWVEQRETQQWLVEALTALPPLFRRVVWLRYVGDLPFDEIGQRLGMPTNTAKTYYHRARAQLRALFSTEKAKEDGSPAGSTRI